MYKLRLLLWQDFLSDFPIDSFSKYSHKSNKSYCQYLKIIKLLHHNKILTIKKNGRKNDITLTTKGQILSSILKNLKVELIVK